MFTATKTVKTTTAQHANNFVAACEKYGFSFTVSPNVVKIAKSITPGSKDEYNDAETDASCIFDHVPLKGGSVWGSDGLSIGGAIAMQTGVFKMNKSGNGNAFYNAVQKLTK